MLKPKRLKVGDTVGIISTSSPVAALCPERLERGILEIERMGFKVKVGKNVVKKLDYLAGTVEERLEDFHNFIGDSEVKAVINTIGGFNSNQLIEYIDYELIKQNPKIIIGYSDFTAVLLSIYQKTNLVTFLGPAVLPQFGEYNGLINYSKKSFEDILINSSFPLEVMHSRQWTCEFLEWDKHDIRERKNVLNKGPKIVREGEMKGEILAGNMGTMLLLAGSSFIPSFENKILFIEDDEDEKPATIDRYLHHLRSIKAFDKINGIVIGRFHPKVSFSEEYSLSNIIKQATKNYNFPIVVDFDFGHTDPMMTLPNGINASIKAYSDNVQFIIEETPTI